MLSNILVNVIGAIGKAVCFWMRASFAERLPSLFRVGRQTFNVTGSFIMCLFAISAAAEEQRWVSFPARQSKMVGRCGRSPTLEEKPVNRCRAVVEGNC